MSRPGVNIQPLRNPHNPVPGRAYANNHDLVNALVVQLDQLQRVYYANGVDNSPRASVTAGLRTLEARLNQTEQQLATVTTERDNARQQAAAQPNLAALRTERDNYRDEYNHVRQQLDALRTERDNYRDECNNARQQLDALRTERDNYRDKRNNARQKSDALRTERDNYRDEYNNARQKLDALRTERNNYRDEYNNARQKLAAALQQLAALGYR